MGEVGMNTSIILQANKSREDAINRLIDVIMNLPIGKAWRVKWEVARESRSDKQNAALWGCAYAFLERETGNDPDDMHQYFCGEYFGWVEKNIFGRRKLVPRRTTTKDEDGNRNVITTLQFMEFYEFIQRRVAVTVGLNVPDPDPHWREHMEEAA